MEEDNSNDVVMVEPSEDSNTAVPSTSETRPIMQLFQRLISNNNKQNTVLTNVQIISILQDEFNIDITTLHDLEVDIYLNIVKRFLKDWPQWDEFDRGINIFRKQKDDESIKKTLENKYRNLKEYLKAMIESTKPLAQEAVSELLKSNAETMEKVDTSNIVLEIYCTRKQFNQFIFDRPNPQLEHTVFNLPDYEPPRITVNSLPISSIVNWWGVRISIELKSFSYSRSTKHDLKHMLVNKKNGPRNLKSILNQNLQIKDRKKISDDVDKTKLYNILNGVLNMHKYPNTSNNQMYSFFQTVFNIIKSDLDFENCDTIKVPATYRQYSNKYPYYRKLCKEVEGPSVATLENNYDLYIEEVCTPMHLFHIGKVGKLETVLPPNHTWMTIECGECQIKFTGVELSTALKEHFDALHANESDWFCTNCEKSFSMANLTQNKWHHEC